MQGRRTRRGVRSDEDEIHRAHLREEPPDAVGTKVHDLRIVGKGAYGVVFRGKIRPEEAAVAMKCVFDIFGNAVDAIRTLREISLMRQMHHPCIIDLETVFSPPDPSRFQCLWIVLDYGGRDLKAWMREVPRPVDPNLLIEVFYKMLAGINFMHLSNIVHRDLKPSNILIKANPDGTVAVKIIDFGLAREIKPITDAVAASGGGGSSSSSDSGSSAAAAASSKVDKPRKLSGLAALRGRPHLVRQLTMHVVTRWYRAPELMLGQHEYNEKIDVWSMGCILAEMLQTLNPPLARQRAPDPIFPGRSSNNSPTGYDSDESSAAQIKRLTGDDQLKRIFRIIGTPAADEIKGVHDPDWNKFLTDLTPIARRNLHDLPVVRRATRGAARRRSWRGCARTASPSQPLTPPSPTAAPSSVGRRNRGTGPDAPVRPREAPLDEGARRTPLFRRVPGHRARSAAAPRRGLRLL